MTTPAALTLDDRADWFDLANDEMDILINTRHIFSADDLRDKLPAPAHANWWGALFGAAHKAGRIKPMGFQLSRTKSRRGGVVRVWAQVIEHEDRTP